MASAGALDVVVVSYRCRNLLRDCLASLGTHAPRRKSTVFVVDNGSNDGTVELVRESFPDVRLLVNDRIEGFSSANNRAIEPGPQNTCSRSTRTHA